ncbi:glycerophosphodiester phosphodiesterase family protein [Labedella endophytica]|uniref:Glycerophosphodiester phosphodiesterase n=1 Tax=Labedella endophytica TaxID=1523160 RepID=A0A433JMZ3_9MICO|nr:glycerophosphodiester phosphodiesterase family protein [Labedella endophytica]RUQ97102.1 glycerophosphodiester phosphodiesterase [Labedella endophytica]
MTSRYFDSPLPRVFAHRGLATHVPENTVSAFRAAVDTGADYVETDAHVTSDGVAVLAHDPVFRVGGRSVEIARTSMAELDSIDLGGGNHPPRLLDALEALPRTRFNIDVKAPGAVQAVAHAIRTAAATDRVLVTSFDARTRSNAVRALPGVATSASSDLVALALLPARLGLSGIVRRILRGVPCVQVPERHRGIAVVTHRTIRTFHAAGVEVHVWTVDDPDDMWRLVALGVDGIVTDRSDLAARALRTSI